MRSERPLFYACGVSADGFGLKGCCPIPRRGIHPKIYGIPVPPRAASALNLSSSGPILCSTPEHCVAQAKNLAHKTQEPLSCKPGRL